MTFSSTTGDSPSAITTHFPAGLLATSTLLDAQNGNAPCLANLANSPHATDPSCAITAGGSTATFSTGGPPITAPANEYLVAAPNGATDVAGILLAVFNGTTFAPAGPPADVTVRSADSGLDVTFSNIPGPLTNPAGPQLQSLHLVLSDERLPSSCQAEQMTTNIASEQGGSAAPTAPYQSTGCPSQPYAPKATAQVKNLGGGSAEVLANISQASTEAASKTIELDLPSSLSPSTADIGCLTGAPCVVGTASANTPLAPSAALAHGTVTLEGPLTAPKMVVSFPAPYALSFTGLINLSTGSVTVNNVPDVPITSLSLDIKNSQFGSAFTTTCAPSDIGTKFTGQGGQTSSAQVPISYTGCGSATTTPTTTVGKPMVTGSLSGLGARRPVLTLHVKHGSNAPNISSVSISLSSGLNFNSKGIVKHKHCSGSGTHRKCTVTFTAKGLTISGASLKSVKLSSGRLVITLRPAGQATFTIRGPVLAETKSLQKKVKHNKVKHIPVKVKTVDGKGHTASTTLQLKA